MTEFANDHLLARKPNKDVETLSVFIPVADGTLDAPDTLTHLTLEARNALDARVRDRQGWRRIGEVRLTGTTRALGLSGVTFEADAINGAAS